MVGGAWRTRDGLNVTDLLGEGASQTLQSGCVLKSSNRYLNVKKLKKMKENFSEA